MRFISAAAFFVGLMLGSLAAPAQVPCSEAPVCPETGAIPSGDILPNCSCPRPDSCPDPNIYSCGLGPGDMDWICRCEPVDERGESGGTGEPPDPGFCAGLKCADDLPPTPEGGQCLCKTSPGDTLCTGQCANGAAPKALGSECACTDETAHCSDHICADGKPPLVTTHGGCVCGNGDPANPILIED